MIKVLKRFSYFLLCLLFFLQLFIIFLPKEQIFNYLKDKTKAYHVILHSKIAKDKGIKLLLKNNSLVYNGLKVASIKNISVDIFIFYTQINIKNTILSEIIENIMPRHISQIKIYWSPFILNHIGLKANGAMGVVSGYIDLFHKKIILILKPSKLMRTRYSATLRQMKKSNKGYRYVYNF